MTFCDTCQRYLDDPEYCADCAAVNDFEADYYYDFEVGYYNDGDESYYYDRKVDDDYYE